MDYDFEQKTRMDVYFLTLWCSDDTTRLLKNKSTKVWQKCYIQSVFKYTNAIPVRKW